jgi:hypothetical protein
MTTIGIIYDNSNCGYSCVSIFGIKQVTEQEVFLGRFVADVVEGINHLKNAEASQQQKGIELLNSCNLSAFSKLF